MTKTRPTLSPDATAEERAAYWASLSKRERLALLKAQSGPLATTSSVRVSAVAGLRSRAGQA